MGLPVPVAPARHLIKKYANRKLYDTRTSRYITLEGIAQLVREGHEIEVVDRDNGNNLTQVTLSQIVLSEEKRGIGDLETPFRRDTGLGRSCRRVSSSPFLTNILS